MRTKTLYVSDLDGTLLNSQKAISEHSAEILSKCMEKGMQFAVATARMPYGCDYRLKDIPMHTPGIVTNGVFLYDFSKKVYLTAESIAKPSAGRALECFERHGLGCFLYLYNFRGISLYYNDSQLREQTQYYSERALASCVQVKELGDFKEVFSTGEVAYITYSGSREQLLPVCGELDQIPGVSYSFYLNIYNGLYCLEVFSDTASKKNALLKLKKMTGCEELVVFGDNLNDMSMIEIADRSYAPENALEEVKAKVTEVLADHDHDGVAEFLAREWDV